MGHRPGGETTKIMVTHLWDTKQTYVGYFLFMHLINLKHLLIRQNTLKGYIFGEVHECFSGKRVGSACKASLREKYCLNGMHLVIFVSAACFKLCEGFKPIFKVLQSSPSQNWLTNTKRKGYFYSSRIFHMCLQFWSFLPGVMGHHKSIRFLITACIGVPQST